MRFLHGYAIITAVLALACGTERSNTNTGGGGDRVCDPGSTQVCDCLGGAEGVQECRDDASGWESCTCAPAEGEGEGAEGEGEGEGPAEGEGEGPAEGEGEGPAEGEGEGPGTFPGGSFTVTLRDVNDDCFDGALRAIILPMGDVQDLPSPLVLPPHHALPTAIDIDFNDPFQDVTGVQIEADGPDGMKTSGAGMENRGVDLNANMGGDPCLMDMTITASIDIIDDNTITGEATMHVTKAEGDGCSVDFTERAAAGCNVTVRLDGVK